jgi:hypothetical protein
VVNDVDGNGRRGVRPEPGRRRNPAAVLRRWSGSTGGGGGGEARVGAGDHGSGVNLACGGLWRPVRGTVVGARGGDAAGAVVGHNRGGKVAPCDRQSVAELRA